MTRNRKTTSESKVLARLHKVAKARGGKCLATEGRGYSAKYPFVCRNCHEFSASAQHVLYSESWCPECAHGRVTAKNNLTATHPAIAAEWHPTKNALLPKQVKATSQYRAWWRCIKGHDWYQGISSRTKSTNKFTHGDCPTCGSLGMQAAHLIDEWDQQKNGTLTPFAVRPFSNKSVWWKCARGHGWRAPVNNRYGGSQCPKCSAGNASSRREFRLVAELNHVLGNVRHRVKVDGVEVDVLLPSLSMAIEYDGRRWHANKIAEDGRKSRFLIKRGYRIIRVREKGLPVIAGEFVTVDPKDLRKQDIDAVLRLMFNAERMPTKVVRYLAASRLANEAGYLRLMESFPTTPERNLQATHPELAKQWSEKNAPLLPSAFSFGSHYVAWWRCDVDERHEWQMPIKERTGQGQGCPYCSGRRVSHSNSVAANRKDLLRIWNYELNDVSPDQVSLGSSRVVWWKCMRKGGHVYQMSVKAKVAGQGCAVCSGKQVVPELSFGAIYPDRAAYWDKTRNGDLSPLQVTPFSGKRVFWICRKGHRWRLPVSRMVKRTTLCLECSRPAKGGAGNRSGGRRV